MADPLPVMTLTSVRNWAQARDWTLRQGIAFTFVVAGGESDLRVGLTPDRGQALSYLYQLLCGEIVAAVGLDPDDSWAQSVGPWKCHLKVSAVLDDIGFGAFHG